MEIKYTPVGQRAKSLFIDIDGVIFKQGNSWPDVYHDTQVLPGSKEKLVEWNLAGHRIILTTGRPECFRALTEKQLVDNFIPYDLLLMGLPTGQRVVLNDLKPEQSDVSMAIAVNLMRDQGMTDVEL
jgi:hydroxymethylpyrimidine pyrophosphatase-like HAD family hydrolase